MAKTLALTDYVSVDGTDLSLYARTVNVSSEHTQVDVSGFNSTGTDEFLMGNTVQSVEVEFFWSPAVHDVLYQPHRDKEAVAFAYRPNGQSSSDPQLTGNVYIQNYNPQMARGEGRPFTVTFTTSDSTGLVWAAT